MHFYALLYYILCAVSQVYHKSNICQVCSDKPFFGVIHRHFSIKVQQKTERSFRRFFLTNSKLNLHTLRFHFYKTTRPHSNWATWTFSCFWSLTCIRTRSLFHTTIVINALTAVGGGYYGFTAISKGTILCCRYAVVRNIRPVPK